jgi:3-hydroxy-9,10-secoandrosta-1,3,5(10)-triene-9,17-dione monooxygenase
MSISTPVAPSMELQPDHAMIEKARELGEFAWSLQDEAEANRRLSQPVIDALLDSGLLKLATSRRMGGLEANPITIVEVGRELSRGCVALGWLYGLTTGHQWYLSATSERLQEEVRDSAPGLIVDSLVPGGKAENVDGGFDLSGHWKWVSGVQWCSWAGLAFIGTLPERDEPEMLVAMVPRQELMIIDTWDTVGLRGTASNEVTLDGAFVPAHRVFALGRFAATNEPQGEVAEDGTIFKFSFMGLPAIELCFAALGGAQRAIDEFTHWTKVRVRAYEHTTASEAPYSQLTLADAIAKWDAAHALMLQYVRDQWTRASEQGRVPLDDLTRARMFAQRAFIARTSAELTNQLMLDSGANALFHTSAMQQIWRDTNAAAMHMVNGRGDALTSFGRNLMGFPGHHFA